MGLVLSILAFALAIPGLAAAAGQHSPGPVDLDLSSTTPNLRASNASAAAPIMICVGGKSFAVTSQTPVTPAEMVAVHQVRAAGRQSIQIGKHGSAVGGIAVIPSSLANNSGSLVIPLGVKVIDNCFRLSLGGSLINAGSLFVVSAAHGVGAATITAKNIVNRRKAIITNELPEGGLPGVLGARPNIGLILRAKGRLANSGAIKSAGSLIVTMRSSISNRPGAVVQAAGKVDIGSQTGAFKNAGLIESKSADINLTTSTAMSDFTINNTGGSLQAVNGAINIRGRSFSGTPNTTLSGGDFISRNLNLNSGRGAVNVAIKNVTGEIGVTARSVRMTASAPVLRVAKLEAAEDPILVNTRGDIDLDAMTPTSGNEFIAIASRNILSTKGTTSIDTSSAAGPGGNVLLVAGAKTVEGRQSTTIQGRSATGGDINLGNLTSSTINTQSSANGYPGGTVTIVAFSQAPGSPRGGHITLPPGLAVETGGDGNAASGQIVMIGEAKSSRAWPVTIKTGDLDTAGSQNASAILIETATPSAQTFPATISGGTSTPEQPSNGTVLSGIFQFGTLQEGAISTGTLTAANAGGAVLALAGSNASGGPAISIPTINNSGTNGSGRVLLMAGATARQTRANGFDITTGPIDTHSATAQSGYPVTLITPGAISTGPVNSSNTSGALTANNLGGGGEITMVAGSYYKTNCGITVEGGLNSSSTATYASPGPGGQGDGSATITIIGLSAGADINISNSNGPAIYTKATGQYSGSGALVIATPGAITLENNSSNSSNVIDTSGSPLTTYGSQVFLASGKTRGQAVNILANGAPGNLETTGTGIGVGVVWVLTAGGSFTQGYTVNGDPSGGNNFTDLGASKPLQPGTQLTLNFQPGSDPKGYCPGGYTAIKDNRTRPIKINIVGSGNRQPLEVPLMVTGAVGIDLINPQSLITYQNDNPGAKQEYDSTMKLFSAGPIVAPIGNAYAGQGFGVTNAISTTGNIALSSLTSPVSTFNTDATPGSFTLTSNTPIMSFGQMVAGESININTTSGSNAGFQLSPITAWECFNLANQVNITTDGTGAIQGDGQVYCDKMVLRSDTGDISGYSGPDFNINAAMVGFNTSGAVNIYDGFPAVILQPSTGYPVNFTDSGPGQNPGTTEITGNH